MAKDPMRLGLPGILRGQRQSRDRRQFLARSTGLLFALWGELAMALAAIAFVRDTHMRIRWLVNIKESGNS